MAVEINPDDVALYIKVRGVYDGWSVAKMKDGRLINRWPPDDRRHAATEKYISWAQELGMFDKEEGKPDE